VRHQLCELVPKPLQAWVTVSNILFGIWMFCKWKFLLLNSFFLWFANTSISFQYISKPEGGLSLDSRSADKKLKVVTPEKWSLCHYLYQKSWCPYANYSEPEVIIFPLNKPNWLIWKNSFIFQYSQFWFFGSYQLVLSQGSN